MKKLTASDVTEIANDFGTSESEVRRIEALIDKGFDETKIGTCIDPKENGEEIARFRERISRGQTMRLGA